MRPLSPALRIRRCRPLVLGRAIGRRQENAKKSSSGEGTRELFRHPSGCFGSVALRDNARPEVASSCKKLGAVRCTVRHHRWRSPRCDPRHTLISARTWESFVSVQPLDRSPEMNVHAVVVIRGGKLRLPDLPRRRALSDLSTWISQAPARRTTEVREISALRSSQLSRISV